MEFFALTIILIALAAVALALANRVSANPPAAEHSDLAEEAEHRTELPDEAAPLDRRERRR